MAGKVVGWVFANAPADLSAGDMLVALFLAEHADIQGHHAYPSVPELARGTRLSERQVIRCLNRLKAVGVIELERSPTNRLPAMYCFPGFGERLNGAARRAPNDTSRGDTATCQDVAPNGQDVTPSNGLGVTFATSRGDISDTHIYTELEPSEEPPDSAGAPARGGAVSPYGLFAAFCEVAGQDVSAYSDRDKGKHLAVMKRLIGEGATEPEVRAFVGWVRSQTWRTGLLTAFTVEKEIGAWRAAGRPEQEESKRRKSDADWNKGGTGKWVG